MRKAKTFISLACVFWVGCMVPSEAIKLPNFQSQHQFFSSELFDIKVTSLNIGPIDTALAESFWFPHKLKSIGYSFREWILQVPNWLYITQDSIHPEKRQVILRQEVADEFAGAKSEEVYLQAVSAIEIESAKFAKLNGVQPDVFIIPTKISADHTRVSISNVRVTDRKLLEIDEHSPKVGSERHQAEIERRLRESKASVLSVLDLYSRSWETDYPIYPYGSSHWSLALIEKVSLEILTQLKISHSIDESCFELAAFEKLPPAKRSNSTADFVKILGVDLDSQMAKSIETFEPENRLPDFSNRLGRNDCPVFYYVGTSYGRFPNGPGKITDAMSLVYKGTVKNLSVEGKGPLFSIENFNEKIDPKNSIVIWEFPFRFAKGMFVKDGKPTYDEFRTH